MDVETVSMESVLNGLGRCGRFQITVVIFAHLCKFLLAFSMLFMAFGNYDPGWRCVHNTTQTGSFPDSNMTSSFPNATFPGFEKGYCQRLSSCNQVEFNPESSTIVTEWGLICDRSWITSLIISIQMAGVLIGAYLTGYLGDGIGRKYTILLFVLMSVIINFVAMFSLSWPMFATCRFFIGVISAVFRFMPFVYSSEFIPPAWRAAIASIPFFGVSAIVLAVVCMVTKDWRQIHLITAIASIIILIATAWIPRSLRWLVIHGKEKDAFKVAVMMAKWNGKTLPESSCITSLVSKHKNDDASTNKYSYLKLFRKSVRVPSLVIGFLFLTLALTYFAINFGLKALPGDLYINFIIIVSAGNVANVYGSLVANYIGRRASVILVLAIASLSLFGVVAFDLIASSHTKDIGILTLVIVARVCTNATWYVMTAYMAELYPTVIRASVSGWGSLNAQIGAIIAPYLVPTKPEYLYICYIIMGCLNTVCCFSILLLPETNGLTLKDTWIEKDSVRKDCQDIIHLNPPGDDVKSIAPESGTKNPHTFEL